jgi:hypothetical protein
MIQKLNI